MKEFIKLLHNPVLATIEQKQKEIWDVKGRLENSNQIFKFDIRPLKPVKNKLEKIGYFKSKSDKMVFETDNNWIIFDTEELNNYVKSSNKTDFNVDELLDNLTWNIILLK